MSSRTLTSSSEDQPNRGLHETLARLRNHLETIRDTVHEAIRSYPTPIAGCDQQFNHLLEHREVVAQELRRLNSIGSDQAPPGWQVGALAGFVRSSACLDEETRTRLMAELEPWSPAGRRTTGT